MVVPGANGYQALYQCVVRTSFHEECNCKITVGFVFNHIWNEFTEWLVQMIFARQETVTRAQTPAKRQHARAVAH
jgi:hypothetical protein